jgi:hypothetical protein
MHGQARAYNRVMAERCRPVCAGIGRQSGGRPVSALSRELVERQNQRRVGNVHRDRRSRVKAMRARIGWLHLHGVTFRPTALPIFALGTPVHQGRSRLYCAVAVSFIINSNLSLIFKKIVRIHQRRCQASFATAIHMSSPCIYYIHKLTVQKNLKK